MEKRREERYGEARLYRDYVVFRIREQSGRYVAAELCDFSRRGIRLKTPFPPEVGSAIECLISLPKSLTKEIPMTTKVKHCTRDGDRGDYLIGAEIVETGSEIWFDLFLKVHDFIKERIGEIF